MGDCTTFIDTDKALSVDLKYWLSRGIMANNNLGNDRPTFAISPFTIRYVFPYPNRILRVVRRHR